MKIRKNTVYRSTTAMILGLSLTLSISGCGKAAVNNVALPTSTAGTDADVAGSATDTAGTGKTSSGTSDTGSTTPAGTADAGRTDVTIDKEETTDGESTGDSTAVSTGTGVSVTGGSSTKAASSDLASSLKPETSAASGYTSGSSGAKKDTGTTSESKAACDESTSLLGSVKDYLFGTKMDSSCSESLIASSGAAASDADGYTSDGSCDDAEVSDPYEGTSDDVKPQAGLLTAGEWNDNSNWAFFENLVKTQGFDFMAFRFTPSARVTVNVTSSQKAVAGATVTLNSSDGTVLYTAVTNNKGTAYLFFNPFANDASLFNGFDFTKDASGLTVTAVGADGRKATENVTLSGDAVTFKDSYKQDDGDAYYDYGYSGDDSGYYEIDPETLTDGTVYTDDMIRSDLTTAKASGSIGSEAYDAIISDTSAADDDNQNQNENNNEENTDVKHIVCDTAVNVELEDEVSQTDGLDVLFLFDTTGSMGDELSYLQAEFKDIAEKIPSDGTRYSMNFYRDNGDDYVVSSNPFTSKINEALEEINAASSDGGGDFPEAVDQALADAVNNHDWRKNSTKLVFIILDAPAHDTQDIVSSLHATILKAASEGIRIIPIASSGIDSQTEAMLRDMSVLTGGTYTFLTDDSGVGESHEVPTIGDFTVEHLNDLIVRVVKNYTE